MEAAAGPDRDSVAADQAEGREAVRARAGAAARVAAEVCGKRGNPLAEAEVLVVLVEDLGAPAAVLVLGEDLAVLVEGLEALAGVEAAQVQERAAGDLAVLVEGLEVPVGVEAARVRERAAGDLEVLVEGLEVPVGVEAAQVRERAAAGGLAVDLELAGREVVDPVEEAEDRAEDLAEVAAGQEEADKPQSLGNGLRRRHCCAAGRWEESRECWEADPAGWEAA